MNEGLNPKVLEPTDTSWMDTPPGWLEETKGMVERGMRKFERKRPEMHRGLSVRQQINAAVQQARAKKGQSENGKKAK